MTGAAALRRALAVLAMLLAVSACAVGPDFHRPTPPTIARYTPPDAGPAEAVGPQRLSPGAEIRADWWTLLRSPDLDGLITRALSANSDLAAARAALRAAHQTTLSQAGILFPSVDASAASSRNKSSQYLSPVLNAEQFYYTLQTAQLNISYTVDVFGGLRRQVEGAKAQEEAQRFQTEGVYLTLVSNVVAAAVQEASLRGQLEAATRAAALGADILRIMRAQQSLGQIARSDVLLQEAALAQAEAIVPPLQKQLAQARDLLAYLTGRTPGEGGIATIRLEALTLPADLPLTLPSKLVDQRPDVRAAEANLHAASAAVGVALAARLPEVTLSGFAGGSGDRWSNLFSHGADFWSFGAGLTQPIFQGGALYRKQKAAEAQLDQAKALYRSAVLTAFQNVADVLQALAIDAGALKTAERAQAAALASLEIARRQTGLGQAPGVAALIAEQTLRQADLSLVQARAARFTDTAALFQALGGGWRARGPAQDPPGP